MNEQKPHLQSYLSRLADEELGEESPRTAPPSPHPGEAAAVPASRHPSSRRLDDYAADGLSEEEANAVREHLAVCAACTDRLLARLDPPGGEGEPFELSEEEREAQWRRLQRSIGRAPRAAFQSRERPGALALGVRTATDNFSELSGGPVPDVSGGPTRRALRWSLALAATFLLTTCLALFWGWREQRIPDPEINLPIAMLVPEEVRTRGPGTSPAEPMALADEARTVVVVLVLPISALAEEGAVYQVVMVNGEGEELWSSDGLYDLQQRGLQVALPRRLLPQGPAHLSLSRTRPGPVEEIATYTLELEP